MSDIPDDPLAKQHPYFNTKLTKKQSTPAPVKEEKINLSQVEDVYSPSKQKPASEEIDLKDQQKVKAWVSQLMNEDEFPDVREDKVQEAKQRMQWGYENEKEVLQKTAQAILKDLGL